MDALEVLEFSRIIFIKSVCFNKSMQIRNGRSDGTILFTHSMNPSFAARYVLLENIIIHIIIPSIMTVRKCFLKLNTLKSESFGIIRYIIAKKIKRINFNKLITF